MSLVRNMLSVVMDGITDTGMIAGYAEEARVSGAERSVAEWFAARAKSRLASLERDWHDVHEELSQHGKQDSELLDALACHVNYSIAALKSRVEKV